MELAWNLGSRRFVNAAGNNNLLYWCNASQAFHLFPCPANFNGRVEVMDPHVWLDPVLAKQQVNNILQALIKADRRIKRTSQRMLRLTVPSWII